VIRLERQMRARWGRWFRYFRDRYHDQGRTDMQFAHDLGLTHGAVSNMLSRKRDVGFNAIMKVRCLFGRVATDLTLDRLTFTDPPKNPDPERRP